MCNLLKYKFSQLGFTGLNENNAPSTASAIRNHKTFSFRYVTLKEILNVIDKLNINKPLGPSNIPAWALKDGKMELAEPLCFLFNQFITEGIFPSSLKKAKVTPLYKKGCPEDPNNYRPISVTGALAKIFETLLRDQIDAFLLSNSLISNCQYGYKKKTSTQDALLYCTEKIRTCIDTNQFVHGAFLDLSKAFDSLSHNILLAKLKQIGFENSAIQIIQSYLSNRQQVVTLGQIESDWIEVQRGVPQGTVLGPLLFSLYINDLQNVLSSECEIVQYADDTFIFCNDKDSGKAKQMLERFIINVIDYFEKHQLVVNKDKTEYIIFSRNKSMTGQILDVNGEKVCSKDTVKYLGVYLDQHLSYDFEVKKITQKYGCGNTSLVLNRKLHS